MNTRIRLFYIFLITFEIGCSSKSNIKEFDFSVILKAKVSIASKSISPTKLSLCKKLPFKWDNIVILPPYSNSEVVRKQNLINVKEIEKILPSLTLNEGICVLLFIENNTIVRYSLVSVI